MFDIEAFLFGLEIQCEKEDLIKAGLLKEEVDAYFEFYLNSIINELLKGEKEK